MPCSRSLLTQQALSPHQLLVEPVQPAARPAVRHQQHQLLVVQQLAHRQRHQLLVVQQLAHRQQHQVLVVQQLAHRQQQAVVSLLHDTNTINERTLF